jgi:DNA gyrase/topoisomerase IV subunit A
VAEIPPVASGALDWSQAAQQETRGGETLATVLPIARMALFENCVQISRRGYAKKVKETFLETYVASGNVGTGVVTPADKPFCLALCSEEDLLVIVSREGALLSTPVAALPFTIQEALRLGPTDHVVAAFVIRDEGYFLAVTQNGKVFYRDRSWLEPAGDARSQGRAILSKTRLQAGVRLVGAAPVSERHWGIALAADGQFSLTRIRAAFGAGSLLAPGSELEVLGFTAFDV